MTAPVAAPSRVRSKRQQQIVQMVEGYDSTFTISMALRNLFLLWTLYGLALVVFAALAFVANPLSEAANTTQRTVDAVRGGSLFLFLFTVVVAGAWYAKCVANVPRLGRKATIGVFARLKRHVMAFCLGCMSLLFIFFIPSLAVLFVVAAICLFFYSQMWFHLLLLDIVRMLWSTSSPPNGQKEDVDHYVLVWFGSWVMFISLLVSDADAAGIDQQAMNGLTVLAGGACVVSAVLASRLVAEISRRQDARLFAIIREVDEAEEVKPVTDQDIAAAWNRSAGMIEMPH